MKNSYFTICRMIVIMVWILILIIQLVGLPQHLLELLLVDIVSLEKAQFFKHGPDEQVLLEFILFKNVQIPLVQLLFIRACCTFWESKYINSFFEDVLFLDIHHFVNDVLLCLYIGISSLLLFQELHFAYFCQVFRL